MYQKILWNKNYNVQKTRGALCLVQNSKIKWLQLNSKMQIVLEHFQRPTAQFMKQLFWQKILFCLKRWDGERLITESEDEVQQEDDGVDDGDCSLGNANVLPVIVQGDPLVVVELDGQNTAGGEQDHTTQTVEEILKIKLI